MGGRILCLEFFLQTIIFANLGAIFGGGIGRPLMDRQDCFLRLESEYIINRIQRVIRWSQITSFSAPQEQP